MTPTELKSMETQSTVFFTLIIVCQSPCARNLSVQGKSPIGLCLLIPCFNFFSSSCSHTSDGPSRTHQRAWKTLPITSPTGAYCVISHFTHDTGGLLLAGGWEGQSLRVPSTLPLLSSTLPSKSMNSSSHAWILHVPSSPWPRQGCQEPRDHPQSKS